MKIFMPITFLGAFLMALCSGLNNRFYGPQKASNTVQTARPTLVFDLGGVLVDTDKSKVMWQIGPMALFNYWRHSKDPHALKAKLYETLNKTSNTVGNPFNVKDDEGNLMPLLMVEWLRGTRPNAEILSLITDAIKDNPSWFESAAEQKVVKNLASVIFTPEIFAKTRCIKPGALELVMHFKDQGFQIYGVSNWDAESIVHMKSNNSELFDLFDHLVISGEVHALKPDLNIFKPILERMPADHCIYIDDQEENIAAAEQIGMHTIRVYSDGDTPLVGSIQEHLEKILPHEMDEKSTQPKSA